MTDSKIEASDFELLNLPPGWEKEIVSATEIQFHYQHYYLPVEARPHAWMPTYSLRDSPDQRPGFVVHKTRHDEFFLPDASPGGTKPGEATDDHDTLFSQIQDACRYQQPKYQKYRIKLIAEFSDTFPLDLVRQLRREYQTLYNVLKAVAAAPTEIEGLGPKRAAHILSKQKTGLPSFADSVCMVSCPNCSFAWWQFTPERYSARTLEDYELLHCPACNHDTFTQQSIAPREISLDAFEPHEEISKPQSIAPYSEPPLLAPE